MNKYMKFNFNAEKVTKEEYEEWNRITFPAFYKIWILVFVVEVLLQT